MSIKMKGEKIAFLESPVLSCLSSAMVASSFQCNVITTRACARGKVDRQQGRRHWYGHVDFLQLREN